MESITDRFEQEIISEKKFKDTDFDKVIEEILLMTNINDHMSALVKGAELLNNISGKGVKLLKLVKYIKEIYEIEGELPDGLTKYRYLKYKDMTKLAKVVLDTDKYELFINAF